MEKKKAAFLFAALALFAMMFAGCMLGDDIDTLREKARGKDTDHTHNYIGSFVTAPTCGADGYTTQICSNCSATQQINPTAATGAHNYDSEEICTVCGRRKGTCMEVWFEDGVWKREEWGC